ncbi:sporulation delaying protein family toxin [Pyxidicoccus sp. 3LFB2]
MKRFNHLRLTSAATAFITFATFGAGCGGPSDMGTGTPSSESRPQTLSGHNLYKGMVFGVGPAAHHFDDLWQRPELKSKLEGADLQAKRDTAAEAIIAKIAQQDPTYFERFANDLRSGDHLAIDRLLTETKERTFAAAEALRQDAGMKGELTLSDSRQVEAGTWFYVETVVAVALAAVLVVAVTQIDVTPVMDGPQSSALRRDVWVDMLAKKTFDAR